MSGQACCPGREGQRGWPYTAHWFVIHDGDGAIDTSLSYLPGGLPKTDLELAEAAAAMMREAGAPLLYAEQAKTWHMWDGSGRYAAQPVTFIIEMARWLAGWVHEALEDVLAAVAEQIAAMPPGAQGEVRARAAKAWGPHKSFRTRIWNDAGQRAVRSALAARLATDAEALDRKPGRIITDNGVLDYAQIARDGFAVLFPHDPGSLVTKRCGAGVAWEPDARCPAWERFLETSVPDAGQRWWLCYRTACALFGEMPRKGFVNLIGVTHSGKSTFINVIAALAGEYGQPVPVETFLAKRTGDQFSKHLLKGARFVCTQEPDEHQLYDVAFMKTVTGRDPQTTRTLYEGYVQWVPQCTPFIGSNAPIRFNTGDAAMMDREEAIRFERGYETADPDLEARLLAELPGILAYLVRFAAAVKYGKPQLPVSVVAERERMAVATEDALEFIAEYIENGLLAEAGPEVPAYHCIVRSRLYDAYRLHWCPANGVRPVNMRTFVAIVDRKYPKARSGQRVFTGLAATDRWQ